MRMFLLPNETTPCSFFTSQQLMYNKTALGNDACAIGVIAGGGAVILCIAVLFMCAAFLCCCRRRRRKLSKLIIKLLMAVILSEPHNTLRSSLLSCLIILGRAHDKETSEGIRYIVLRLKPFSRHS